MFNSNKYFEVSRNKPNQSKTKQKKMKNFGEKNNKSLMRHLKKNTKINRERFCVHEQEDSVS